MSMRQRIARLLLLGAFHVLPTALCLPNYNCNGRHRDCPYESNVFYQHQPIPILSTASPTPSTGLAGGSPTPAPTNGKCVTNQDGFGGAIGTEIFTVQYTYELELTTNRIKPLESILFTLERSIADFILETTEFRNVPCDGRRLIDDTSTDAFRGKRRRKLTPVGLSINPLDQLNEQLTCEAKTENAVCQLVDGALQVYTVGESEADLKLPGLLLEKLKVAMNNGDFDNVDEEIRRVTFVDINSIGGTDELNNGDAPVQVRAGSDPRGVNTGIVIGASVAALVVLGGLVFYRRRQLSKNNDDDELGSMPGAGSVNSNVV